MAIYSIDNYGSGFYGRTIGASFTVPNFQARSIRGGRVHVTWETPGGAWTQFRLLRNFYGYSETPDDGVVLGEWEAGGLPLSLTDYGQPSADVDPTQYTLPPEQFVYYTVMLKPGADEWVQAGRVVALSHGRYDTSGMLYDYLPDYWRERDAETTTRFIDGAPDPSGVFSAPLKRFLDLVGQEFDLIRTEYTSLLWLRDADRISGDLVGLLARDFGADLDDGELGVTQSRRLARNITYLHKVKGTKPGIEGAVSAYTGYGAEASIGANLCFSDSFGHWSSGTPVFLLVSSDDTTDTFEYGLRLKDSTSTKSAPTAFSLEDLYRAEPNTEYTFYIRSRLVSATGGTPRVLLRIEEYDETGALGDNTAAWVNTTTDFAGGTVTMTTSATGVYLRLSVSAYGGDHLLTRPMLAQASAITDADWEPARRIDLNLAPLRQNLVDNPSFEVNLAGWDVENATLTRSTDAAVVNQYSARLVADGSADVVLTTVAPTYSSYTEGY